ncbi:MAG: cation:proton antiporter [Bacteroidales bacterium]|nr:cation:proton antiporter [Bacteroidales bacterium]
MDLVFDLAVILIAAGICTILSRALKQPLILGYIVAGFIVGPHLGLFPNLISSSENIHQWSEIGIIFLLFGLGLEFSFKKLLSVGSAALITAVTNCIGMFIVGSVTGTALGWTNMESLFLGGLMSMSSTTIIIKAYNELGMKNAPHANLVFGILVVEDLIAVLLMVLLSTVAVSNQFSGGALLLALAKLVFFIILCFVVGMYVIPILFKKARQYLSDEILLLVSIGLCFIMVALASYFGFSSSLGAFIMGSLLSETIESERISKLTEQIKDLFGAIFFVSVGMMVDPVIIGQNWLTILILTVVAMVGLMTFSMAGTLLSGKGLQTAVNVGFSLAQLGEFSFIIASLGCSLGVLRGFIYPVIIAVSVITTFTTPYMIKAAAPVYGWLQTHLPEKLLKRLTPAPTQKKRSSKSEESEWKTVIKQYLMRIGIYGLFLIAIYLGGIHLLRPFIATKFLDIAPVWQHVIGAGVTLLVMSPFLYGMSVSNSHQMMESVKKLIARNPDNKIPVFSMIILRVLLSAVMVMVVLMSFLHLKGWAVPVLFLVGFAFFFLARSSMHKFSRMEKRFFENLKEKEMYERGRTPISSSFKDKLSEYDVHIYKYTVPANSAYSGKKLRELPFRSEHQVNIVNIIRGDRFILTPGGDEIIYPHDVLMACGSTAQLANFAERMAEVVPAGVENSRGEFALETITLAEGSFMTGKTLRELSLRKEGCMVVSVLRGEQFITNPPADFSFEAGDTVWMSGLKDNVAKFL